MTPWQTLFAYFTAQQDDVEAMIRASQAHAASKLDKAEYDKWLKQIGGK